MNEKGDTKGMFSKHSLIASIIVALVLCAVTDALAITVSASPNPAIINKAVTFTIAVTTDSPPSDIYISFGDARGDGRLVGTVTQTDSTLQITHIYDKAGIYTISVHDADFDAEPPNPATMTLRVEDFDIKRIETVFDTGRPEVTLFRNQPAPELSTIINYSGTGFIKGYWEVDGIKKHHFFKQLSVGPQEVITYPSMPGLSTFKPGSHVVRFVITEPLLDIPFPRVVYYVTEQAYVTETEIAVLTPGSGGPLPFKPLTLAWQSVPNTEVYMVHIFKQPDQAPIFSAYSKKNSYALRPEILARFLKPGETYHYTIQGFHEDTRLTGKSVMTQLTFDN